MLKIGSLKQYKFIRIKWVNSILKHLVNFPLHIFKNIFPDDFFMRLTLISYNKLFVFTIIYI